MTNIWKNRCQIAPSLIYFDMCDLARQVRQVEAAGVEVLHVDLIDGHFSPSLPLGVETVKQLRKVSNLKFDVHLMVENPEWLVAELLDIGVNQLLFHSETAPHVNRLLGMIRRRGVRAGVALKPATALSELDCILEECDAVLLMLTNPGFSLTNSETQAAYADRKIRALRAMIDGRGLETIIEIDGRVTRQNIENYGCGIVNVFVAGSACFSRENMVSDLSSLVGAARSLNSAACAAGGAR
ncbi:MAG: ribulose-phosphate 3-epimerase [Propionivibrio sp.]